MGVITQSWATNYSMTMGIGMEYQNGIEYPGKVLNFRIFAGIFQKFQIFRFLVKSLYESVGKHTHGYYAM